MVSGAHGSPNAVVQRAWHAPTWRAFTAACWWPLRFGAFLWLSDVALAVAARSTAARVLLAGAFEALCATLLVSAGLGVAAGLLAGLSVWRPRSQFLPPERPLQARFRAWFAPSAEAEQLARSGLLLGSAALFALYALVSVRLGQRIVTGMAKPEFAALAMLALHLALLGGAALLFRPFRSLGSWLGYGLGRLPRLGERLFATPLHFALWLCALLVTAVTLFLIAYRTPLSYLPLVEIRQTAGALLLTAVWSFFHAHLPRTPVRIVRFVAAMAVVCGLVYGFVLASPQRPSRYLAQRELLTGRHAYVALTLLFDGDRDGYLSMLGGGDCAPRNPRVHPGAVDVPDNHVDEDCDGEDLHHEKLPPIGQFAFPVPGDVPQRPPVILITVDAFAATRLAALGAKRAAMPHLDAFAGKSALFSNCFVQGPSTRLSFPALFTSRLDSQIQQTLMGGHPFPIDPSELMLAEMMQGAGYATVAVLPDPYFGPQHWLGLTAGFAQVMETPYATAKPLPHTGPRVTEAAISALGQARWQPLFLWVHYFDAHGPHDMPGDTAAKAKAKAQGKSASEAYEAELTLVDGELQKLLSAIEQTFHGQALVVIAGDHSNAFDEPRHRLFHYGFDLSTAVLNVPCIVHAPFVPARRIDGVVSSMDIMPTIANVLRLSGPFSFQGTSLVPELLTGTASRPPQVVQQFFIEEMLWQDADPLLKISLRTDRFNLIHDRAAGFYELYEYRKDYNETNELSGRPEHQQTFQKMKRELALLTYLTHPWQPKTQEGKVKPAAPTGTPDGAAQE